MENKLNSHTMIGTPYYISPEMYKYKNYDKKGNGGTLAGKDWKRSRLRCFTKNCPFPGK